MLEFGERLVCRLRNGGRGFPASGEIQRKLMVPMLSLFEPINRTGLIAATQTHSFHEQ